MERSHGVLAHLHNLALGFVFLFFLNLAAIRDTSRENKSLSRGSGGSAERKRDAEQEEITGEAFGSDDVFYYTWLLLAEAAFSVHCPAYK